MAEFVVFVDTGEILVDGCRCSSDKTLRPSPVACSGDNIDCVAERLEQVRWEAVFHPPQVILLQFPG